MRGLLGILLGLLARVWVATLRLTVVAHPAFAQACKENAPLVFAFFHGTQFPLLRWSRRRPMGVLVSLSKDGAIQARAMAILGMKVVRGSSSRRGAAALRELARRMRDLGEDAAFAVDGPRGPYGVAKPGVFACANAVGAQIVPVGSFAERAFVLEKAWDRFVLPLPFSRVRISIGAPLGAELAKKDHALDLAIARANEDAARELVVAEPHALGERG